VSVLAEVALDLVEPLELRLEQAASERVDEREVALAVWDRSGYSFCLLDALQVLEELVSQGGQACEERVGAENSVCRSSLVGAPTLIVPLLSVSRARANTRSHPAWQGCVSPCACA
jgi:hypothetical protein